MAWGWIKPEEYSFNSFLLLERFQIQLMLDSAGWQREKEEWRASMAIALRANPAVAWYFKRRCPQCEALVDELLANASPLPNGEDIRRAEIFVLASVEDFTIYTTPELMAERCDFIRGWSKERLYELADLSAKVVLDVGSGSGRLAFAAAERAAWVYASEPVGTLRDFMRDKIAREGISNVRVLDGLITDLPFPDATFDIVMNGHVVGDDWDKEIAEMSRVCKPGGWLLDVPGDSERDLKPLTELTSRGWEELHYIGSFDKDVYTHRKQVSK